MRLGRAWGLAQWPWDCIPPGESLICCWFYTKLAAVLLLADTPSLGCRRADGAEGPRGSEGLEQQQKFRADQHKVGGIKGKKPHPIAQAIATVALELESGWSHCKKGSSMLGEKSSGSGNDPAGLDPAGDACQGLLPPICLGSPTPGKLLPTMDRIILLYIFILTFLGQQEGLALRSGPAGLLEGFCRTPLGTISPSPLAGSHF